MSLTLLALVLAGGLVTAGAFWSEIVEWLSETVADFICDIFGADLKKSFLEVIAKADKTAVTARNAVKRVFVKAQVLFHLQGSKASKSSVSYLRNPENPSTAIRRTITEEISVNDLPPDLKKKLRAEGQVQGELTMRQIV